MIFLSMFKPAEQSLAFQSTDFILAIVLVMYENINCVACDIVGCTAGFTGLNCTDTCDEGSYGYLCGLTCNCTKGEICHHINGCKPGIISFPLKAHVYM